MALQVTCVKIPQDFEKVRAIRLQMFIHKQHFEEEGEFDDDDVHQSALHFIGTDVEQNKVVAVARVLMDDYKRKAKLSRVAVLSECRGKHYGVVLMDAVEDYIHDHMNLFVLTALIEKKGSTKRCRVFFRGIESLLTFPFATRGKMALVMSDSVVGLNNDTVNLTRAVVLVRKDDHNPFFQISGILNAWIMMNVVGLLQGGEMFQNRVVHFDSAILAPYETSGPLMSHLDDHQPCYANAMISDFRDLALKSMFVMPRDAKTDPRRCLVTVISRRPYGGRRVQRVWQNEEEVLRLMREDYKDAYRFGECEFQALEFVNMAIHDQIRVMLDSDVVIGMHGAGMVNVMWTRPKTLVVEIFPRARYRWGYRNLCQYLGCRWYDFRQGRDVRIHTSDPNDMDKQIPYMTWKSFFDPLFRNVIAQLEKKIGDAQDD
ncbi:hypothetical protein JM16_007663 [Phytophthora kernoviae]|uniref:N-acetyltransferase domain-containing protein n=1 Tax=Phytophthora kernoviae TaxID=325452 RepID=A0A8T0LN55_9STRA|nr:hypothetical protein JM16_007663 [Phytophthora kernoviae]